MSDPSIEVFKVNDGAIKVRGRVEVSNRVEVRGRVQVHGHMKTSISGNIVQISGQTIITSISGLIVNISGSIVEISGQAVTTDVSGSIVQISGQTIELETPSIVLTGAVGSNPLAVTGASGGVRLSSGVIVSAVLKSPSTNSGDIYIGGSVGPTHRFVPFSGYGFILSKGDTLMFDIDNFSRIFVVATVSGDIVSFMGVD